MITEMERMKQLVDLLNDAGRAYYQEAREIMSNFEYDALYDELTELEKETGMTLSNSPTIHVGYEVVSELPKETHSTTMLSLDKTKERDVLKSWLGDQKGLLSWKLDGLTIVLTYRNGILEKAVTRGNGNVGEVITNNAKTFKNLPLTISFKGELILRGEAVIKYSDFDKINKQIQEVEAKYKNPRNLCSGSVRQLNNEITAKRNVNFMAFSLVSCQEQEKSEKIDFKNSREQQFKWLQQQGFEIVEYKVVNYENIEETIEWFSKEVERNDLPSDGLVLLYDDIIYGKSLGSTSKFPKDSIAFKWKDEKKGTVLREIEWSASRTGLINPVAIFEPVELEGTTVSRASVHNLSIMEQLELGIGDIIEVYKANMIIPQIAENQTRSGKIKIPKVCPVCGENTTIKQETDVKVLYCENPNCLAKKIKSFTHFVSRNAMNIDGLSEATIEKLIAKGFIKEYADIFHLEQYKDEMINMEGFGEKSFKNLIQSIETAKQVSLPKFIYSLGIPNIGLANAKLICKAFDNDIDKVLEATEEELVEIEGIGTIIATTITEFLQKDENKLIIQDLLKEVNLETEDIVKGYSKLKDMTFVITGTLEQFSNRNELKEIIEQQGGKVTGSVTKKTTYLINNDKTSGSSKNKKAKELGIEIISEEDLIRMIG